MTKETIDNDKYDKYISILRKVEHKPIVIEFIFSFIKYNPYIFIELIEKDKALASSINSIFKPVKKKNNNLSKTINNNIKILLFYKHFKEYIFDYYPDDIFEYEQYFYDQGFSKKTIDPSFINFKLKFILEKASEKNCLNIPENELSNIYYQAVRSMETISIIYLPKINWGTKQIYIDGTYIEDIINNENNNLNQTIENLICIIDDNEYYNKVKPMNKNISINKIYFLLIKGHREISIYNAINSYLKKINSHSVTEIIFGKEFFLGREIENNNFIRYKFPIFDLLKEEVFLKKKTFVLPGLKSIKLDYVNYMFEKKQLYLGLSLLFPNSNINIDGVTIIDCKKDEDIYEKLDKFSGGTLILKTHSLSLLEKMKNKILDIEKISSLIIYISEELKKNYEIKNINVISYFLKAKSLLLYSEVPLKGFDDYKNIKNQYTLTTIKDKKNDLILLEKAEKNYLAFNDFYFLLNKYYYLSFE